MSLTPYSPPLASLTELSAPAALRPASRRRRFCASLIHLLLLMAASFSYSIATAALLSPLANGDAVVTSVSALTQLRILELAAMVLAWLFIAGQLALMWKKKATLGKYWLGIRVCRSDGSTLSIGRYLLRELPLLALLITPLLLQLPLLGWALYFLALAPVFRADRRTLSDLWSDTNVIREPAHA